MLPGMLTHTHTLTHTYTHTIDAKYSTDTTSRILKPHSVHQYIYKR
jgi:hypothetical protein